MPLSSRPLPIELNQALLSLELVPLLLDQPAHRRQVRGPIQLQRLLPARHAGDPDLRTLGDLLLAANTVEHGDHRMAADDAAAVTGVDNMVAGAGVNNAGEPPFDFDYGDDGEVALSGAGVCRGYAARPQGAILDAALAAVRRWQA